MIQKVIKTVLFSLAMLIFLLFPMPGSCAPVSLEYVLGFQGYFQLNAWTPLTVVLENRGRAMDGRLEVIVTSGSEYLGDVRQTPFALDVELPYNSSKLCAFTIPIETFTHDLLIRLRQNEELILSQTINLRPHYTTKALAVVVDDKTSPDFLSVLPDDLLAVNVRPRFLPETWYGYDGVELLIMNAEMIQSLRDRQFQALQEWIKRGGALVTAGGVNYGAFSDKRTARLLPLRITGLKQVTELASLQGFCGHTLSSPEPFLILDVNIPDATAIVQEASLPIIHQRAFGTGNILFLAFDFQNPPFSRWPQRPAFWQKIRSLFPAFERKDIRIDPHNIIEILLANMPLRFPESWVMGGFLVIYLLALRILIRQIGKQPDTRVRLKIGASLLFLMIFFSLLSYALFFRPQISKKLSYNSFLHLHLAGQQKIAFGEYLIGLYSLKTTAYTLNLGADFAPITPVLPIASEKSTPQNFMIYEQEGAQYISGTSEQWVPGFFMAQTALEFPMLTEARHDHQGLQLTINNMTPYAISNCWAYVDNRLFALGDVAADSAFTFSTSKSEFEQTPMLDEQSLRQFVQEFRVNGVSSATKTIQKGLFKTALREMQAKYQTTQHIISVLGWIQSNVIQAHFTQPGILGDDLTLLTWEIPLNTP
ncbi:hypothetical protein U27_05385 [Candidatus Vecturithrix granuli]|uniref:Glutamine amidotransferase domain-containing protein n=1 Tax=Vecturithrix granuli TaxID=1499967 RepID=A0A081C1F6_VECG1|nr:hypothetical protein U27_05385 [Candidatus Vecturithrix granuli]